MRQELDFRGENGLLLHIIEYHHSTHDSVQYHVMSLEQVPSKLLSRTQLLISKCSDLAYMTKYPRTFCSSSPDIFSKHNNWHYSNIVLASGGSQSV